MNILYINNCYMENSSSYWDILVHVGYFMQMLIKCQLKFATSQFSVNLILQLWESHTSDQSYATFIAFNFMQCAIFANNKSFLPVSL